jgi:class 3 adenylate cyclase
VKPNDLPETCFAQSGDVNIAYQVMGEGPLNLVVIWGMMSHVEFMHELPGHTDFLRRLSRFARVVIFDKRGQGLSDRVVGVPTLEERVDDVRAIMDALNMERAVLLGVSEGTAMSVFFAATHPDRVSHLALWGGFARFASTDGYPIGRPEEQLRQSVSLYGTGVLFRLAAPGWAADPLTEPLLGKYERLSCSPGNFRAVMEMNLRIDVRQILGEIRVPTLVMHRRSDQLIPFESGKYLADHIPEAVLREYASGGHYPTDGSWEEICGDIEEFVTGERHDAPEAVERILATVLFTDIVESTSQAAQMGDASWRKTLDEHDRIARNLVERHRGRLIKTTGDGILATFDGPGRAVRCALAMEPALTRLNLSVRAGLHTGEVEERGDDIGGIAVNAASRVMSKAGAGEVLVSRVVADLVGGSGLVFADRGDTDLKGIPGTWRLFAASL